MAATEQNMYCEEIPEEISACLYQLPASKMRTEFHHGNYKRATLWILWLSRKKSGFFEVKLEVKAR